MKKFILVACLLSISNFSYAVNKKSQFVSELLAQTVAVVDNPKYNKTQKENEIVKLHSKYIDFYWNARIAIGKYWSLMSEQQQKVYLNQYTNLLCYSWIVKFTEYTSQNAIQVKINPEPINVNSTDDLIETKIIPPNGEYIGIDILIRETEDANIKILNIVIEGMNIAIAYKNQFEELLEQNHGNLDLFLKYLQDKNAVNKKNNPNLKI